MTSAIKAASRRMTAFLAAILVVLGITTQTLVAKPVQAAYHQAYIQTTVDTSTWEILAGAVDVTSGMILNSQPQEYKRMKGLLDTLASCETPAAAASHIGETPGGGGSSSKNLLLTFPGDARSDSVVTRTSSDDKDLARAAFVRSSLIYDLNSAFKFVYGQNYQPSGSDSDARLQQYQADMKTFLQQIDGGSHSLTVNGKTYSFSSGTSGRNNRFPDKVTNATDYVTISGPDGAQSFLFRMIKGYVDDSSRHVDGNTVPSTLGLSAVDSSKDVKFVHWGYLAIEAFVNYSSADELAITTDNVYNSTPTAFEKAISGFVGMLANGLTSVLGLWSFDELIFNDGVRGTNAYVGGIFPTSWQPIIWTFFFLFEIAAIVVLLYAIIFNVGRRAMATMNPIVRANAIDQIQYLFLVVLGLGLLPAILQLLINVNFNLTGIFTDALGDVTAVERFQSLATSSGSLVSVLTYLVYLGAVIYFNVFYGIRALMISFLIITGPIFIAFMGVSETKRRLVIAWAKELAANLFIQPLQAMMMAFILSVPSTGRHIDSLVMAYAMIPLTNVLRGLFIGDTGGLIHQIAERGKRSGMRALKTGAEIATTTSVSAFAGGLAAFNTIHGKGGNSSNTGKDTQKGKTEEDSAKENTAANKTVPTASTDTKQTKETKTEESGKPVVENTAEAIDPGTPSASTNTSNQVRQSMIANQSYSKENGSSATDGGATAATGAAAAEENPHFGKSGFAMAIGAIAAGAIGGGMSGFTRRAFGAKDGGAIVTQISRSLAKDANSRFHPTKTTQQQGSGQNTEPIVSSTEMTSPKKDYSAVVRNDGNVFERGVAEKVPIGKDNDQYRIDREDMPDAGIQRTRPMGEGQSLVSYNMDTLGASDAARASAMLDVWNNGNAQEKAILQNAGITDVRPRSKMVNGEEKVTGVDMTVNSAAFAENFGTSFDKNGMTMTTKVGSTPQIVPDAVGYINQAKTMSNHKNDAAVAHSAVSQVAQNMGITQDVASPQMVTFMAPTQEALTDFMNEVPQLKQTNASITPVSNNGTTRYQMSIPKEQYDGLLVTQEIPSSQVYTDIMSARSENATPSFTPPPMPQKPTSGGTESSQQPVPTTPVAEPAPQVNSCVQGHQPTAMTPQQMQEPQSIVTTAPQQVIVQHGGEESHQQGSSMVVEMPIQAKPIEVSGGQSVPHPTPVKDYHEELQTSPTPQGQPQKDKGNRSGEQEKQGGQFRR